MKPPPVIFGTLLEHGAEVPNNEGIIFSLHDVAYNGNDSHKVTVKASRKALLDYGGVKIYSLCQVFDTNGKEIFHELYPSQLSERQGELMIDTVKLNIADYIK